MDFDDTDVDPTAFLKHVEMQVRRLISDGAFPETRTDRYTLQDDGGGTTRQSAAGLPRYDRKERLGAWVVSGVNLDTVSVAGSETECLVTGVEGQESVVPLQSDWTVHTSHRVL